MRKRDRDRLALKEAKKEYLKIELSDLYTSQSKYTPEEKVRAVMTYITVGTINMAAKLMEMPQPTLDAWKNHASWWDETVLLCRKKKQDELDAICTSVIHNTLGKIADQVTEGDWKLTKDGVKVRVPIPGKELAGILAIIFDKRQLLRGEATSRVEKVSEQDKLNRLAKSFEEMSIKMKEQGMDAKVIGDNDNVSRKESTKEESSNQKEK